MFPSILSTCITQALRLLCIGRALLTTPTKAMNKKEVKVLEDMKAFLQFALDNSEDYSFSTVLGTIAHDVRGLFNEEDDLFLPRTSGYSTRSKA